MLARSFYLGMEKPSGENGRAAWSAGKVFEEVGDEETYELLGAAFVAVGDVVDEFAFDVEMGLQEREVPVLELGLIADELLFEL